jgi:hypothetical protein
VRRCSPPLLAAPQSATHALASNEPSPNRVSVPWAGPIDADLSLRGSPHRVRVHRGFVDPALRFFGAALRGAAARNTVASPFTRRRTDPVVTPGRVARRPFRHGIEPGAAAGAPPSNTTNRQLTIVESGLRSSLGPIGATCTRGFPTSWALALRTFGYSGPIRRTRRFRVLLSERSLCFRPSFSPIRPSRTKPQPAIGVQVTAAHLWLVSRGTKCAPRSVDRSAPGSRCASSRTSDPAPVEVVRMPRVGGTDSEWRWHRWGPARGTETRFGDGRFDGECTGSRTLLRAAKRSGAAQHRGAGEQRASTAADGKIGDSTPGTDAHYRNEGREIGL